MKTFATILLAGVASATLMEANDMKFIQYIAKHNKEYKSTDEFEFRKGQWAIKEDFIQTHNADTTMTHKVGHNQFSDWTHEEYKQLLGYHPELRTETREQVKLPNSNNDTVNWVEKGAVTAVKDQGRCGSCWSFSTTGALEGAWFIAGNGLVSRSEEQLVQCDYGILKNLGCNGGLMDKAFEYCKTNAIATEEDYPYTSGGGTKGTCDTSKLANADLTITSYTDVTVGDSDALKAALDQQPVSVAIEADQMVFQQYTSGVITSGCGTNLDHGVLAVGYGTLDGNDYFLVKNSWAATWGDNGYVRIGTNNQCGILNGPPSYPTI